MSHVRRTLVGTRSELLSDVKGITSFRMACRIFGLFSYTCIHAPLNPIDDSVAELSLHSGLFPDSREIRVADSDPDYGFVFQAKYRRRITFPMFVPFMSLG